MLNKVVLIGRLTKDAELRYTTTGVAVCTFTLAVDRNFGGQDGNNQADFIPIVTWRKLAENCGKYLAKGRLVAVAGRIQVRTYETQEGQRRYVTEVVVDEVRFLGRNTGDTAQTQNNGYPPPGNYGAPVQHSTDSDTQIEGFHTDDEPEVSPDEDDLPF